MDFHTLLDLQQKLRYRGYDSLGLVSLDTLRLEVDREIRKAMAAGNVETECLFVTFQKPSRAEYNDRFQCMLCGMCPRVGDLGKIEEYAVGPDGRCFQFGCGTPPEGFRVVQDIRAERAAKQEGDNAGFIGC